MTRPTRVSEQQGRQSGKTFRFLSTVELARAQGFDVEIFTASPPCATPMPAREVTPSVVEFFPLKKDAR